MLAFLNSHWTAALPNRKKLEDQPKTSRRPQQERALHKVGLILEAAMRLLEKGGLAQLSTNAVAHTAGVSIGTLYQYFPNKEAILDALSDCEMADLSARVLQVIEDPRPMAHGDRARSIMHEVASSYGRRRRVHRLVVEHSLTRGGVRIAPMIQQVVAVLTSGEHSPAPVPLSEAEAFVLTNAFVGVMRGMIMREDDTSLADEDIEEALARLISVFAEHGLEARRSSDGG
jgi:AcrR family transcriptional regulator